MAPLTNVPHPLGDDDVIDLVFSGDKSKTGEGCEMTHMLKFSSLTSWVEHGVLKFRTGFDPGNSSTRIRDVYQRGKDKQIKEELENTLFDQGFAPLHSSPPFLSPFSQSRLISLACFGAVPYSTGECTHSTPVFTCVVMSKHHSHFIIESTGKMNAPDGAADGDKRL